MTNPNTNIPDRRGWCQDCGTMLTREMEFDSECCVNCQHSRANGSILFAGILRAHFPGVARA